jgi:putative transposase
MPRKSRIDTPGALHHIIARGIERRLIFDDDDDRDDFLKRLGVVLTETKTICYAWALIPNHLNSLRADIVSDLKSLKNYAYSGHSALMGKRTRVWQSTGHPEN